MTEQPYNTARNPEVSQFGMQALWRLAIWGGIATFALFVAVIAGYSNAGSQRQTPATTTGQGASGQGTKQPRATLGETTAQPSESAEETRRLAEAVRNLAADRDQALARIAALERNLDGVTGTIKRDRTAGPPQPPPQISPQAPPQSSTQNPAAAPATTATVPVVRPELPAVPVTVTAISPTPAPAPPAGAAEAASPAAPDAGHRAMASASNPARATAPAEPLPAAAGLGVDVGGATNYEGLRTLWHSTKSTELPDELYPLVAVRENSKTHGVDLRLVIGPIPDAEAASRLCMTLAEARHYCQPVAFEGQRLAMIETASTKAASTKAAAPPRHPGLSHSSISPEPFSNANYPRGK
jgi:hypothetical protein